MRNEARNITTFKRYAQSMMNNTVANYEMEILEEMDKLSKISLIKTDMKNNSEQLYLYSYEYAIKNLTTRRTSDPDGFSVKFIKSLRKK